MPPRDPEGRSGPDGAPEAIPEDPVGRLSGSVGHEFNNLLTAVLGEAIALEESVDPAAREHARSLRALVDRGALLTGRLLAIGRRNVVRPQELELEAEARRFTEGFRRWLPPNVSLELKADGTGARVLLDRDELEQVLHALLTNAVQAMPDGGRLLVEVRSAPSARVALLRVVDTGVGIEEPVRARLFEPFFSTRPGAAGLGLPTARAIAERAGGLLVVEPATGRGTAVSLRFPLVRSKEERPPTPVPGSLGVLGGAPEPKVLVVDDEPMVRRATARVLRRAGWQIVEAADGEEALERLAADPAIGLVVTDVIMPRLGGVELAQRVRRERRLPVILLSGYADGLTGDAAALPFLGKPYEPRELVELVRSTLPPGRIG